MVFHLDANEPPALPGSLISDVDIERRPVSGVAFVTSARRELKVDSGHGIDASVRRLRNTEVANVRSSASSRTS